MDNNRTATTTTKKVMATKINKWINKSKINIMRFWYHIICRRTSQTFCCNCGQTFICKKFYISKLLAEVGLSNSKSKKYSKPAHSIEKIIQTNINYFKNLLL